MTLQTLDFIFPFAVFTYGLIMTFVLNSQFFLNLAEEKLPQALYAQITSHRHLGILCLIIGSFWSAQNLMFLDTLPILP